MDRAPAIKRAAPSSKFAHTSPPQPSPVPHHLKHTARRAVTPLQSRCCRGASSRSATAEVVDDQIVAVLPPLSLSLSPLALCHSPPPLHAHALAISCTGTPPGARRRHPVPVETAPPSPTNPCTPGAATAPVAFPKPPPSLSAVAAISRALGEPLESPPVAGRTVAPPVLRRRRCVRPGPLDLDPTATCRFGFSEKLLSPETQFRLATFTSNLWKIYCTKIYNLCMVEKI